MIDVSKTIAPKSDQLNADDLIGGPRTITVTGVKEAQGDQPIAVHFEGDNNKPYKPCKSMRRVLVKVWGNNGANYIGQSMTLYNDPTVSFGGNAVGGIRISHMTGVDGSVKMALTVSRARRAPYVIEPLVIQASDRTEFFDMASKAASCGTNAYVKWFRGQSKQDQSWFAKDKRHDENKNIATAVDANQGDDDHA